MRRTKPQKQGKHIAPADQTRGTIPIGANEDSRTSAVDGGEEQER